MFCKKCGTPMKDGARFCPKCGARQDQETEDKPKSAAPVPPGPEKKGKKSKKKFPVWIFVVVLCMAIGVLAAVLAPRVIESLSGGAGTEQDADEGGSGWGAAQKEKDGGKEESQEAASEPETQTTEAEQPETTTAPTTAAPEIPTPETTTAQLLSGMPDLTRYARVGIVQSGSTSNIMQENNQNGPEMAVDGDEVTSWQEGVEGPGIGETIYYKLDQEQYISYITFKLGNWRNDKYFYGNNRPRTLTITLDDYTFQMTFPAEKTEYVVQLDPPYPASYAEFRIDDVYQGSSYDDTCIAEIGIYCRVGE